MWHAVWHAARRAACLCGGGERRSLAVGVRRGLRAVHLDERRRRRAGRRGPAAHAQHARVHILYSFAQL